MQQLTLDPLTKAGTVHWIDHYVVNSADVPRWEAFHERLLGAVKFPDPRGEIPGAFQWVGSIRHGAFFARRALPPTLGLDAGLPRYGWYINAADVDAHLRRLDEVGAVHGQPFRTAAEGESGTAIRWQDPDGNQLEFWAPDIVPAGAMTGCSSVGVGRISHAVLESRDLERTADFFARYCSLERVNSTEIPDDTLVLRLGAGGRLVFKQVDRLGLRTTGMGMRDVHTALLVHTDEFVRSYQRLFGELPEWDFDPDSGAHVDNRETLPARTVLHPSMPGRRFHELVGRGDDFLDWDTNLYHFVGGEPVDGSLAVYRDRPFDFYLKAWEAEHGSIDGFREMIRAYER